MAVGRSSTSPRDMTGNSSGNPPASHTPRFTHSEISRKCALQGVNSDQVLQMPITGRPSNKSCGQPWFLTSELRHCSTLVFNSKSRKILRGANRRTIPARRNHSLFSASITGRLGRFRNWLDSPEQKHVAGNAQQQERRCYREGPRERVCRVRYITRDNGGDDRRQLIAKV